MAGPTTGPGKLAEQSMYEHIIWRLTLSILLGGTAALGQAAGEPIRLTLEEDDKLIHDDQVAPAQFIRPLGKLPFRPFSFAIGENETPATEAETTPDAAQTTPPLPQEIPAANQETSVTVRPPEGATVTQAEPTGPLRVYQIHSGQADSNPAAPQGTSTYRDPLPPHPTLPEKANSASAVGAGDASAPAMSRFSAAEPDATPAVTQAATLPVPSPVEPSPAASIAEADPTETGPLTGWTVVPGATSLEALEAAWGAPSQKRRIDPAKQVSIYEAQAEFAQIEIGIEKEKIVSVYLILAEPLARAEIEQRFHLEPLVPAQVKDAHGRALGIVFPEQGLMLPQSALLASGQVDRLIRQAPTAEGFLVRARGRAPSEVRDRLADYKLALEIEPYHAEAWHQTSKILHRLGQLQEAFEAARKATAGVGAVAEHRLHRAILSADLGDIAAALQTTRQIAEDPTLGAGIRAQAYCQWGDLLQQAGPDQNREAVHHHVKAIEMASPLVNDPAVEARRRAKQVLIDAHLALAVDIAAGDWEKKDTTVAQWLKRAKIYVDDMVTNEGGTAEQPLGLLRKSLAAYSYFDTEFNPIDTVDQILGKHRELVRQTDDPFYHRALEWETGQALSQAVFVEHARGRSDEALALAEEARGFLKGGSTARSFTIADRLLLGNLYFRAGAIEAVQRQNHTAATAWYELAIGHLNNPALGQIMLDRRGESLVSMGVSYWSTGHRDRGIELTEAGKTLLETAIEKQAAPAQKLIVPLDNLAKMYQDLGDTQRSAEYTASSERIRQSLTAGEVSR